MAEKKEEARLFASLVPLAKTRIQVEYGNTWEQASEQQRQAVLMQIYREQQQAKKK